MFKILFALSVFFLVWFLGENVIAAAFVTCVFLLLSKLIAVIAKYMVGPSRGH